MSGIVRNRGWVASLGVHRSVVGALATQLRPFSDVHFNATDSEVEEIIEKSLVSWCTRRARHPNHIFSLTGCLPPALRSPAGQGISKEGC
jgi:hypothetical protein